MRSETEIGFSERSSILTTSVSPWQDPRAVSRRSRRLIIDKAVKIATAVSVFLILIPLGDIVYMFVYRGVLAVSIPRLTNLILDGGLANTIVGTVALTALAATFAVPAGIIGGIYLAEFSGENKYARIVWFVSDVLAGFPSIVLGYVGFLLLVVYFGWGFSALAGAVILAVLMLPYVLRTTELSIRKVPKNIREGAEALGSTKTQMINRLTLRLALPGIITGVLLSLSISMGETAPLLYTAGFSNYYPCGFTKCPVGYLTYVVYVFSKLPITDSQNLAYLSAFLLMAFSVVINIVARLGLRRISRIGQS